MLSKIFRPVLLGVLGVVVTSGLARGQTSSVITDGASLFGEEAVRQARAELSRIVRTHGVSVTIQTITTLRGKSIEAAALDEVQQNGHKGIFILIAKQEHKAEATASPRALLEELGRSRIVAIQDAFIEEFRKNRFDEGLQKGVQAVGSALAATRPPAPATKPGFLPTTIETSGGSSAGSSPLVVRQQVRLTLVGARKAIAGAEAKATQEGWKMNFAAVDDGGHLMAFARMDGARPASVATATTKAISAATFRQPTGPLNGSPDVLVNLSLQNASGTKITTLPGGVPIIVDGQVIGAIGVGGGTSEQDLEAAKAGVAAFLEGLQAKPEEEPKPKPKETEAEAKPKADENANAPK